MSTLSAPPPIAAAAPMKGKGVLWTVLLIAVAVALAAGGYWGWNAWQAGRNQDVLAVKWQPVVQGEMQVKVHKDGELQAVNNIEIMSLVEGLATIVQIVKEGTVVKEGDVLVTLDSSTIRQRIEDTTLELQRAESDVAAARNVLEIQKSQNEANLEAAQVDVQLGKLSIQQYLDGTYPADLELADTTLRMAKITQDNKEDDLKQIKDLYTRNFVNLADVKQAELALETTKNDVAKAASALKVLKDYTHPMMLAGKQSYMKQAEQKLVRTKVENQNNLTKAQTALETQEAAKKIMERRLERLKEQLEYCTIKAPSAGLVVYNNLSGRDSSAPIQEGTQVRERQVLLRLPDTSAMKAIVRINEGQVIRLKYDQRALVKVTGIREPIWATLTRISPVSDSSSRWMNPDTREYPVELTLDWTPPNLKPGIGVQVEILVDQFNDALTVPLAAIYSAGADNFVFTRGDNGVPAARKVNIGVANETHVRVVEGLKQGDQVVLLQAGQGRNLLERSGITPTQAETPRAKKPGGKKPAGPTKPDQEKTDPADATAGTAKTEASSEKSSSATGDGAKRAGQAKVVEATE